MNDYDPKKSVCHKLYNAGCHLRTANDGSVQIMFKDHVKIFYPNECDDCSFNIKCELERKRM